MNHFVCLCAPLWLMMRQNRRNELFIFKAGLNSALGFHQHYSLCSLVIQVTVVYMEDKIFFFDLKLSQMACPA